MHDCSTFDHLLADDGPAAVVSEQWLRAVGEENIVFPPTYANPSQKKGDPPVYNLDNVGTEAVPSWLCTIDSVPSQANRMEPALGLVAGGKLVPRVLVTAMQEIDGAKEEVSVNLLDAGHRGADALVRFTKELGPKLSAAFSAVKRRPTNHEPLARINPTSLVFGVWDSRDSGVKLPRVVSSIVRAHDVKVLQRSAQFFPALKYNQAGVASEEKLEKASTAGMAEVPATGSLGGVLVRGGICRRGTLNLVALRNLRAPDDASTLALQRYILGLALVAVTHHDGKCLDLRQGCQLVLDPDRGQTRKLLYADGSERTLDRTAEHAVAFATAAAAAFGVGDGHTDVFDPSAAKKALTKS